MIKSLEKKSISTLIIVREVCHENETRVYEVTAWLGRFDATRSVKFFVKS